MKKILKNIFSLLVLIVIGFAVYEVIHLDMLPSKYLTIFLVGEGVLFLLGFFLYNRKHVFLVILGIILYLVSIIGNGFGYYYLSKTNRYIDHNFAVETYKVTTHYYVLKNVNDPVASMEELSSDTTIYYYKYGRSMEIALAKLGTYSYTASDNISNLLIDLKSQYHYVFLPSATYEHTLESSNFLNREDYAILYEMDIEEEFPKSKEIPTAFSVYINAYDYSGIHSDFNMIVTVNTKTHQVVFTSIPRDYLIDVPAYHIQDTLTYMGYMDPKVTKDALAEFFDIPIQYQVSVNAKSLVTVVDTVGGIDFCSNYDFYTSHDMNVGSYADKGEKLHVTKGCRSYNGVEALAIARERKNIPGGDRARQENCRKIIISIMKKLASTTTLTNYDEILTSFDGLYITDMNKETITNLVKEGLKDSNFEVIEQSVDGKDLGSVSLEVGSAWVVEPDMETVKAASNKIKEVTKEK